MRQLNKPRTKDRLGDIHWLCDSFGFVSGRDTARMSSQILIELLGQMASRQRTTAELLADHLSVTAARVNHHVRHLIDRGLLYRDKRAILLRGGSMKEAVEAMRKDANRIFDELAEIAEDVDAAVGLKSR